jgi:hypothetical protein
VNLSGTGNPVPMLTVAPPNLGFADQDIYSGGITSQFTITNTGSAATDVSLSTILTAANTGEFTVSPTSRNIPADGVPYAFTVTFDPDTLGNRQADIRITPTVGPVRTVAVWGRGIFTIPSITLSIGGLTVVEPLNFGRVLVGKTKTLTVTLTNNDTRNFGSPTLQIVGPDAGAFTCPECDDIGVPFGVGASRTINLSFIPTAIGDYGDVTLDFVGGQNGINGYNIDIDAVAVRPTIKYEEN